MNPAAYYELHYNSGKVSVANGTDDPIVMENQQIFNDVVANFATENNVYIYLQNHLGRSYNRPSKRIIFNSYRANSVFRTDVYPDGYVILITLL